MTGFNQRFIPEYAKITAPLRKLLTEKWCWGKEEATAFDKVRNALKENSILHSYAIGAETRLIVDAGPEGLGAVLVQRQGSVLVPVVYKSRSLKDPESRYSQTEREALAIRWGVKKLRQEHHDLPLLQTTNLWNPCSIKVQQMYHQE